MGIRGTSWCVLVPVRRVLKRLTNDEVNTAVPSDLDPDIKVTPTHSWSTMIDSTEIH